MEASHLAIRGEQADRFAAELVESKARAVRRSINKRGVRNIHTYDGEGFTQLVYERAAAYEDSWLMVSVLVEELDDRTCSVAIYVGGGGRGPFKLEEISARRLLRGEGSVGQAGRFATVLRDVRGVCESLELTVDTLSETEPAPGVAAAVERKVFDS